MLETIVKDITRSTEKGAQAAKGMQLSIQYNPQPTYRGGDPCSVDYAVYAPVAAGMKTFRDAVCKAVTERLPAG